MKYSQSYDIVYQLALLGSKGIIIIIIIIIIIFKIIKKNFINKFSKQTKLIII